MGWVWRGLVLAVAAIGMSGCAAFQVRHDTLQMVDDVSHIREQQVLRNIGAAINDHDMVPSEILLGAGQATVSTSVSGGLKLPELNFSRNTKEFDPAVSDNWTAQWQVAPVTNADDLRRLRDLYVLIASTNEQYDMLEAYFHRHPEQKAPMECYGLQPGSNPGATDEGAAARFLRSDVPAEPETTVAAGHACPPGYGPGQIPKWRKAVDILINGDSIDCRIFQESDPARLSGAAAASRKGLPFRRWLYWRRLGGDWLPEPPQGPPTSLGWHGGWELGTTSRACLNDFVILVQAATPAAEGATEGGPKLMLNTP